MVYIVVFSCSSYMEIVILFIIEIESIPLKGGKMHRQKERVI